MKDVNMIGAVQQDSFFYLKDLQKDFGLKWDEAMKLVLQSVKGLSNKRCSSCKKKLDSENWGTQRYNPEQAFCKDCSPTKDL
ncbi:MAG: hypothetical protein KJ601_08085 [Nanoarchaeota archaeon]|nr:hypothetical protein [Nanoarchaeota archaeon]